jgi:alpha-beta hydrolase superfamily lysophospholipase
MACCLFLLACRAEIPMSPSFNNTPELHKTHFMTRDGVKLPLQTWLPHKHPPKAVILALHGFNDYSQAFVRAGDYFSRQGLALLAYDQRHFGLSPKPGLWAGTAAYVQDLMDFAASARQHYPGLPLYILGESMGGAIAAVTLARPDAPAIEGLILVAPAVWGRDTMPWYQRGLLSLCSHTVPELKLTGKGLKRQPSDNIEVLRGLSRDPWVIKATRVDALSGLSDLMDAALVSGPGLRHQRLLLLYGERDEIIPAPPVRRFMASLEPSANLRTLIYPHGYHLLLRDLGAEQALADIVTWINTPRRN